MKVPPPQEPLRTAQQKAVATLAGQSERQIQWLGANRSGPRWALPVLEGVLQVDPATGDVIDKDGRPVRATWQLLVLHYLAVPTRPGPRRPEVTFASLPAARVYASVYEQRVNRRLCAGVGRHAHLLQGAAAAINARAVDGGDVAFEVNVFPRIPIRLIWYAGDQELAPSCTVLLPANIESFLCIEDIVVLSESFVSRLSGKTF
jgi:hypothetical protein